MGPTPENRQLAALASVLARDGAAEPLAPAVVTPDILRSVEPWWAAFGLPGTATAWYGEGGGRQALGAWPTVRSLDLYLCDNMGGGVPIEVIRGLVVLASEAWSGPRTAWHDRPSPAAPA